MMHRNSASMWILAAAIGFMLGALPIGGQDAGAHLRGFLVAEDEGLPVEGAIIALVNSEDVVSLETLSTRRGAFSLPVPPPGVYRVRVTRIGYQSWASDTLHIASTSESRTILLRVPVKPIPLPELSVSAQNDCPTTPQERTQAFALYESVLPILASVASTADLGALRMRMIRPTIVWKRGGRHYAQDTATVVVEKSFDNASPAHLEMFGYAEVVSDSLTTFYAPDGNALASPGFLATHCLRPVASQSEARVGLGFEPKPSRRVVDVEGVLWIDTVHGGPEELEFQYTSLRPFLRRHLEPSLRAELSSRYRRISFHGTEINESMFGGRFHFEQLAANRWFVPKWEIRSPVLLHRLMVEGGVGTTVWPVAFPVTTSGEVLALIRPES